MMEVDGLTKVAAVTPQKPYTVRQFAELAGLGRNSVYQMISRGELPALRFGGAIRLPREKCDRLLRGETA
jgi:excisionase family DNA binding protein